jgi:hypothetical protein
MADQNIEAIRCIYEEWGRGNFTPKFDLYSPDLEWGWSDEFPGLAGVYHDPAERSERLHEWLSPWEHWRIVAEDYIAHGDLVVVLARYTGRGKGSGVEVDTEGAHVWTLRDGRAVRLEIFADRARALEAVGLAE